MSRMDIQRGNPLTDINVVAAIIDAHPEYFPEPRQLPCVGGCGRTVPSGSFICGQCGTDDEVLARLNALREAAE